MRRFIRTSPSRTTFSRGDRQARWGTLSVAFFPARDRLRYEALFKAVLSVAGDFPRQAKLWISNATANDFPKVNETVWHNNHCTNVSHEATKSEGSVQSALLRARKSRTFRWTTGSRRAGAHISTANRLTLISINEPILGVWCREGRCGEH